MTAKQLNISTTPYSLHHLTSNKRETYINPSPMNLPVNSRISIQLESGHHKFSGPMSNLATHPISYGAQTRKMYRFIPTNSVHGTNIDFSIPFLSSASVYSCLSKSQNVVINDLYPLWFQHNLIATVFFKMAVSSIPAPLYPIHILIKHKHKRLVSFYNLILYNYHLM